MNLEQSAQKLAEARAERDAASSLNRQQRDAAYELISKEEERIRQYRADVDQVYYDRADAIAKAYDEKAQTVVVDFDVDTDA